MSNGLKQLEPLGKTKSETARLLNCTERTIDNLRVAGRLTAIKLGPGKKSKIIIPMASIHAFINGTGNGTGNGQVIA